MHGLPERMQCSAGNDIFTFFSFNLRFRVEFFLPHIITPYTAYIAIVIKPNLFRFHFEDIADVVSCRSSSLGNVR